MATKGRKAASFLIFLVLATRLQNHNVNAQTVSSTEHAPLPGLSRQIASVGIPSTTFLNALFQIGRLSSQCFGVALTQRSSATMEVQNINAENITVKDLVGKVLKASKGFTMREEEGCIVIAQASNKPSYLKTTIPSFRTERSPIELQSYSLFQALSATEPQPAHKGAWGTVSSISGRTDSPDIGPMDLKNRSVEAILCTLAREARSMMWIALPKKEKQPWRFIRYTDSDEVVNFQLREVVENLSE